MSNKSSENKSLLSLRKGKSVLKIIYVIIYKLNNIFLFNYRNGKSRKRDTSFSR